MSIWFKHLNRLKNPFLRRYLTQTAGIHVAQLDVGVDIRVWVGIHSYNWSQPLPPPPLLHVYCRNHLKWIFHLWHIGSYSKWHGTVEKKIRILKPDYWFCHFLCDFRQILFLGFSFPMFARWGWFAQDCYADLGTFAKGLAYRF